MAEFYHNLVTEKSFQILQDLKRNYSFILIGGWAVFLYSKTLKSKDVDIVVDYDLLDKLRGKYDVSKNDRLQKYEIKTGDVDIDIYVPFYSNLGLPVEEISNHTESREGFVLPSPHMLLLLKAFAARERAGTTKGRKDIIDIFSLLATTDIDWRSFSELAKSHDLTALAKWLRQIVSKQTSIKELDLTNHKMARLKKRVLSEMPA